MVTNFSDSTEHGARPDGYPIIIRVLHWISATVIIWAMVSGLWAGSQPEDSAVRHIIGNFNVSLTTLFIPIFCLRIAMRLFITPPTPVAKAAGLNRMAHLAHFALYILTAVVLVTGVLCVDHQMSIFNMVYIDPVLMKTQHRNMLFELHSWSCRALGMMIALHVIAVIWHMRSGRDVIARMSIPVRKRQRPPVTV
jgi:superoxide oxidase